MDVGVTADTVDDSDDGESTGPFVVVRRRGVQDTSGGATDLQEAASSEVANSASVEQPKRILLCLNVFVSLSERLRLQQAGFDVHCLQRFGHAIAPMSVLSVAKAAIRQGSVAWIYGIVRKQHWEHSTWVSECCRLAHRAGAQWCLSFQHSTLTLRPFEMLRRLKHARTYTLACNFGVWLASERVLVSGGGATEMIDQVIGHKTQCLENRALWLDEMNNSIGERTKPQMRADEDAKAVGGLRAPHKAVANWPSAWQHGEWLTSLIDSLPGIDSAATDVALATLGQEELPLAWVTLAVALREILRAELSIQEQGGGGLQGTLIERLAFTLHDPDLLARGWLRDGAVPLGIDKAIEPGGGFPLATVKSAEVDLDKWYQVECDVSCNEHRKGAEAILQRELHRVA